MLNLEISNKLRNIKGFKGVFSRDTLPPITKYPASLVVNTDTRDQPGSHWVAIYFHAKEVAEYFDPYGLPPLHQEFRDYLPTTVTHNEITLQCTECVTCGEYCCVYIFARSKGLPTKDFVKLFKSNKYTNDIIIKNLFQSI
jgi:hypothetical protein